jgi:hypothetical protein
MVASRPVTRKIALWKLVGGAAVHFVVPAYLVALGLDGWRFAVASSGGIEAWLAHVPGISLRFLGAYAALGLGATGTAALIDRTARPAPGAAAEPQAGAADLRMALARGRGVFGERADAALERIGALCVNPGDVAMARMIRDLAAMVTAGRAALDGEDEAQIRALTTEAIERIEQEMARHAQAGAQEARDRVHVMAGYVGQRYGQDGI